jgi:outer membrane protein TolC
MAKKSHTIATFLLSSLVSLPAFSQELHFSEAWKILQTKNSSLAAQRANVTRYQQLQQAKNALDYPTVTLGATYTRLDDDVTLSADDLLNSLDSSTQAALPNLVNSLGATSLAPVIQGLSGLSPTSTIAEKDVFSSSIRAIWPIFTGGRINAAQSIAQGQTEEAESRLEMEVQARYEDLTKYYFSVVLAKAVLQTRLTVEQGLARHKQSAIKLEEQGQIARVERLQAEASLVKATVDRKKAERDLAIASAALTKVLNQQEPVSPQTALFINHRLPPLSAFTDQTLASYPGLSLLDAKEKQARNLLKAEIGNYYPEVYLFGNYNLYEEDNLASKLMPDWMVGIGVNINLTDNQGRSEKAAAAKSAILQVAHTRQQAVKDLSVLVEKTYAEAEQAIEEVEGLNTSLRLADENLKLRQTAFSQGLSTSLDVVDAELYRASVKTQQQAAKFHYIIALNRLLALSSEMETFVHYEYISSRPVHQETES